MSSTLQLYSSFAMLCLLGGSFLAFFALPHLHVPPALLLQARNTLLIASVILASYFGFTPFQGSLARLSRWDLRNLISTCLLLLRARLTFAMLSRVHGLFTLSLVQFLA